MNMPSVQLHLPHPAIPAFAALILMGSPLRAQDTAPEERLLNSDPQQLLQHSQENRSSITMTSIAGFENRDVRETPANVQVITARQIQASGAKDLFDALELIPGLSFGRDVDDVFGISIHGNWAEEGKCLFMLDGRQLNENDFGTYAIGLRIPLANVERIEVVLGPGAVLHGGYASLGMVNIVTRSAEVGTGSRAAFQSGYSNGATTTTQVTISGAHKLSREQEISYMTSHERGHRSNALRLLPDSTWLNFADSTDTQSNTFQFNYRWRDLQATMVYMDQVSAVSDANYSVEQRDIIFGLTYQRKLSGKVEVRARMTHADQLPWYYVNTADADLLLTNTNNQRTSGSSSIIYKPKEWLSARLGTQLYHQNSSFYQRSGEAVFNINNKRVITMDDAALFGELGINSKAGLLSAGYRMERHSLSGSFYAPRVAYTKVLGPFHTKLLWSQAYKTPTVMNLNYALPGTNLLSETIDTKDAELGIRLFHGFNLTVNVFNTRVDNPIVYMYNEKTGDAYLNRPVNGTNGFDVRASYESRKITAMAGFGKNAPLPDTDVPEMQLPSIHQAYQGVPAMRGYFVLAYDLLPSLTIRTKATWRDAVWSYQYAGGDTLSLVEWPEEPVLNAGLTLRPRSSKRFSIDLDCHNITDTRRTVVSPNINATTPFALNGREYLIGLTYKFVQ